MMRVPSFALLLFPLVLGCARTGLEDFGNVASAGPTSAASGPASSSATTGGAGGSTSTATATGTSATTGTSTATATGSGGAGPCIDCSNPQPSGNLQDPALKELSGIVASLVYPDTLYVHNDSGDVPRFFAMSQTGVKLATFTVSGATAVDWEDIARGPCPTGTCVFLADIGDNNEKRSDYVIYRVPEPAMIADATVTAEALPFAYPDGSHNAETLLVHPVTGAITIVTKSKAASSIYELPLPLTPGKSVVAKQVGTITPFTGISLITGGDVHPQAEGVLLRTYTDVFYYPMAKGATVAEALAGKGCTLVPPFESQGEAIGWLPSGKGFITVSEGAGSEIHVAAGCAP